MCLYPRKMINRKYTATAKNTVYVTDVPTNAIPELTDLRCAYIEIPCGNCIECRKQKANEWRCRMSEELREHKYAYFVTLTFSPEELLKLTRETRRCECNLIAGVAVRRFLERWRKKHGKSLRHWCISELGHEGTERLHLHGIIWSDTEIGKEYLEYYWHYGEIWCGEYCNQQTINYIVKYITKIDTDHKGFYGQIFASPGIGRRWVDRHQNDPTYTYRPGKSRTDYVLKNGQKVKMPTYFKNKIYNEDEREKIWRDFMDKEKISIMGIEHTLDIGHKTLTNIINKAQEVNYEQEYGDDSPEWKKTPTNITERMLMSEKKRKLHEIIRKNLHI